MGEQESGRELMVQLDEEGLRLDQWLARRLSVSRNRAQRLIQQGLVRVSGGAAKGRPLSVGDRVYVVGTASEIAVPDDVRGVSLVYEDEHLVVVDKPAGMPSHPLRPGERGTLANALRACYPEMEGVGFGPREPGLVHRLDTDTSGLVIAARDAETFELLRAQLSSGQIDKRYVALCKGQVPAPQVATAYLLADRRKVLIRSQWLRGARQIQTEILESQPCGAFSLVTLRAHVAARHQLRAHLASLGHPIAGDSLYGGPPVVGLGGHFLHAESLEFRHPRGGQRLQLRAPLPRAHRRMLEDTSTPSSGTVADIPAD